MEVGNSKSGELFEVAVYPNHPAHKLFQRNLKNLLTNRTECAIMSMSREEIVQIPMSTMANRNYLKKPLDKLSNLCYNVNVIKGNTP